MSCVLAYPDVWIEEDAVEDGDIGLAGLDGAEAISKELALAKPFPVHDGRISDLIEAEVNSLIICTDSDASDGVNAAMNRALLATIRYRPRVPFDANDLHADVPVEVAHWRLPCLTTATHL